MIDWFDEVSKDVKSHFTESLRVVWHDRVTLSPTDDFISSFSSDIDTEINIDNNLVVTSPVQFIVLFLVRPMPSYWFLGKTPYGVLPYAMTSVRWRRRHRSYKVRQWYISRTV